MRRLFIIERLVFCQDLIRQTSHLAIYQLNLRLGGGVDARAEGGVMKDGDVGGPYNVELGFCPAHTGVGGRVDARAEGGVGEDDEVGCENNFDPARLKFFASSPSDGNAFKAGLGVGCVCAGDVLVEYSVTAFICSGVNVVFTSFVD